MWGHGLSPGPGGRRMGQQRRGGNGNRQEKTQYIYTSRFVKHKYTEKPIGYALTKFAIKKCEL